MSGKAYLFKRRFKSSDSGKIEYKLEEIIVLTDKGIKVGGIYRMGSYDLHCVIKDKYRGQHILSDFCKQGIIGKIWPENKSVELVGCLAKDEYEMKKHITSLLNLTIRNEKEIEERIMMFPE